MRGKVVAELEITRERGTARTAWLSDKRTPHTVARHIEGIPIRLCASCSQDPFSNTIFNKMAS